MKSPSLLSAYLASPYKSIKHSSYFDVYDDLLHDYVGKKITLVEVGVLSGGSLFMWRNFLGPEARIIGIDFNPVAKKWRHHGFEIFIGNQADPHFWDNLKNHISDVDIAIDDGGHTYEQQIQTVEGLIPLMSETSMIIVEDTHTSYIDGFGPHRYSFINYAKNLVDRINYRFGQLRDGNEEARFWSVQFFESIVAFKINLKFSNHISQPTDNLGIHSNEIDMRFEDINQNLYLKFLGSAYHFLKNSYLIGNILWHLKNRFIALRFSAKKYFK